ncbi:MAG: hypothetical protein ACI84D_003778, partial [Thalassolituus oleivorans]
GANTSSSSSSSSSTPQFVITDSEDSNERLRIGVDSTGNGTGFLQAWNEAVGATSLLLNPNGGNVGIGTTTPASPLTLKTGPSSVGFEQTDGTIRVGTYVGGSTTGGKLGTLSNHPLSLFINGGGPILTIGTNSNVGIGTTTPTEAKLVVSGWVLNYTVSPYWFTPAYSPSYTHTGHYHTSIKASNWIVSGSGLIVASDARIKNIKGRSDAAQDLETLNAIRITDYTLKDEVTGGGRPEKKVIAQQVEEVYPQAVSKRTDVVPDIYLKAPIQDGWVTLTTDLKQGERVRLIGLKEEGIHEVLEVEDDRFRTNYKSSDSEVFVYGREVKDFRNVEYDAISMLNVSATQELARKVAELEALNAEKDKGLVAMKERVAELEAGEKARNERLVAIEKLLSAGKSSVIPVSLKTAAE